MAEFAENNFRDLNDFSFMSKTAGARSDYVQGGGGNTSVKLADGLMAIKASGFCLSDIEVDNAYAVLDYEALRGFYYGNDPADFEDVEKQGSAFTKEQVRVIDGLKSRRPSVEAGFHSILKKFVCHTHSVYGNLACCSLDCTDIAAKAFEGADYSWGWVPYTDPGSKLTFAIRDELKRVEHECGRQPAVILMQNHGIIVHADDAKTCLAIHADANERLAHFFGVTGESFPAVGLRELGDGLYTADCGYLTESLKSGKFDYRAFLEAPLYPDQMVFLIGTLFENRAEPAEGEASVDFDKGTVTFRMSAKKAQVIAETLTAVCFIENTVEASGHKLSTMGEAAKSFIANWESEKYRKSMAK